MPFNIFIMGRVSFLSTRIWTADACGLYGGQVLIALNWSPTVCPSRVVSAMPSSLQLVFFVEYTNQQMSVACSDWIGVNVIVVFLMVSHSASHAAKVGKVMVWPAYNITDVFAGGSETLPGK